MEKTNYYNELIKSARKSKGLTQQELADEAGVSLRTVQRIEKGTEEISGYSLKQITKTLDLPLETIIMQNVNQISIDNNQIGSIRVLYLSSLLLIINPILGLIIPITIGYLKKNKDDCYKKQLKKLLIIQAVGLICFIVLQYIIFFQPFKNIVLLKKIHFLNMSGYEILLIILSYSYWIVMVGIIIFNTINIKSKSTN